MDLVPIYCSECLCPLLSSSWKLAEVTLVHLCESLLSHSWEQAQLSHLWSSSCKLTPPMSSPLRLAQGVPCSASHYAYSLCVLVATSTSACRATGTVRPSSGVEAQRGEVPGLPVEMAYLPFMIALLACARWALHISCRHCSSNGPSSAADLQLLPSLQLQILPLYRSHQGIGPWCVHLPTPEIGVSRS